MRNPDCTRCPLHATAKTVCVPGRGNPLRGVMVVGEAPGAQEDEAGRPFVGKSGQLLDAALAEVGLQDAFITNAVRCRPPGNGKPTPAEEAACRIYLAWDIWRVDPVGILALGNHALRALTGKTGITKERGKWHPMIDVLAAESQYAPVFATYHPAYVLRNPAAMDTWAKDFVEFAAYVGEYKSLVPTGYFEAATEEAW